jgi:hypothetical protein
MYDEICLLVTSQIQFPDGHGASNGFLENGRLDGKYPSRRPPVVAQY